MMDIAARSLKIKRGVISRLLNEGLYQEQAYATAVVLLLFVLGMNALSGYVAKKVTKGKNDE